MNNDGFSAPTRNGKRIRGDDVHEPVSNGTVGLRSRSLALGELKLLYIPT